HDRPRVPACRAGTEGGTRQAGSARVSHDGLRHFLDIVDIPAPDLHGMIAVSRAMRAKRGFDGGPPLAGRTLAMIFDKPSTRTRVSFEVAMRQLGGDTVVLTGREMQLGRGE